MEKQKNTIFYLAILICILSLIFIIKVITKKDNIQVSNNNVVQTNTIKNNIVKKNNAVYIESHKGNNYIIEGVVKNTTNKTVKNLKVSAKIYDYNDNKKRDVNTYLDNLAPNETWAFELWTGESNYKYKELKVTYEN